MDDACSPNTICTVGDEAFALYSYDQWKDIYDKTGGIPKQRRGEETQQCDSKITRKYTNGGIWYTEGTHCKAKGWTNEGIGHYNLLFQMVTRDRKQKGFMRKFKN
jgi:hypothetical protein